MVINEEKLLNELKDNNKFIGEIPVLKNSKIILEGKNNIFVCEKNVTIVDSTIEFKGNNSLVYLSSNTHNYKLVISLYNNSKMYIGKNNYFNNAIHIVLSEQQNLLIGNNCVFSMNIWFRTADAHLIYDAKKYNRINTSKSIYIGDHVWLGQGVFILKGTTIDSGSIVGAMSVLSNKKVGPNEAWGGNPAKKLKKNIFWNEKCVHSFTTDDIQKSNDFKTFITNTNYKLNDSIFEFSKKACISFKIIEKNLKAKSPEECLKFIKENLIHYKKNRFVHVYKKKLFVTRVIKKLKKIIGVKE